MISLSDTLKTNDFISDFNSFQYENNPFDVASFIFIFYSKK